MPTRNDSRTVGAWVEYVERYLPDDAKRLERLQCPDPAAMGEQAGRRAIERTLAKLTGVASPDMRSTSQSHPHEEPAAGAGEGGPRGS
jgi:hypothetical protein